MAISLNSVLGFNLKLQSNYQPASRSSIGCNSAIKVHPMTFPLQMYGSAGYIQKLRWGLCLSVADSDQLATNGSISGSGDAERPVSGNQVSAVNPASLDGNKSPSCVSEASNSSMVSSNQQESSSPDLQSTTKEAPLTAKERLRAARVLSRYADSKPSKSEMGSKVLDAMRESDKGKKKSRLPEAPTNLFDDSKRGLPKQGLTFQFPGDMKFKVHACLDMLCYGYRFGFEVPFSRIPLCTPIYAVYDQ